MHDLRSLLAQSLAHYGFADGRDQPLVIAFAASSTLRESPDLTQIRAELRGLGAALLLLAEGRLFTFRPDDELDRHGRSDGYVPDTSARLSGDSGARGLLNDGRAVRRIAWPDGIFHVDTRDSERRLAP